MCASKFSSPKRFYKRPAICAKSPPPSSVIWDPIYPQVLQIDFRVKDHDPTIAFDFFGSFEISRLPTNRFYLGRSEDPAFYIVCEAFPVALLGDWIFNFKIYTPLVHGESHTYRPFIAPDPKILASHNMGDVHVPALDYRYFRVYG